MAKTPQTYIISDTHFGHYDAESRRGIITFERNEFDTIAAHDEYIVNHFHSWRMIPGSTLWHLGDFGELRYLWVFDQLRDAGICVNYIKGNHDSLEDCEEIKKHVDVLYEHPQYLSQKLVLSHEPQNVWPSQVNVHGHLHGSILDKPNYLNASIAVNNYHPITSKQINNAFARIPKYNMRFLYEPYAEMYKFTQPKEDVIMDKDGKIDLSASRVLQRINTERRKIENDSYQPYTGGLDGE